MKKGTKTIVKLDNLSKRNESIYKEYANLWATGLRENLVIKKLSEQYFLSESTLYRVILKYSKNPKKDAK